MSEKNIRLEDGPSSLTLYPHAFGYGGESIYIGRNLNSDFRFIDLYNFEYIIFGDSVTYMPECNKSSQYEGEIKTLIIGKSITIVPQIDEYNIETIRVRSMKPPKAEGFLTKVYLNAVLYVPKGTLSEYQQADVWKEFWTIKEVEMK